MIFNVKDQTEALELLDRLVRHAEGLDEMFVCAAAYQQAKVLAFAFLDSHPDPGWRRDGAFAAVTRHSLFIPG